MSKMENSGIPCSAEIDLTGIPTVGNVTEINCTSKTRKLCGNLTEILTKEMVPEISTKFPELPELPEIAHKFRKETEIPVKTLEIPVKVRKLQVSFATSI